MSKEDIKELKLRLDRIEDKLANCFVRNLNENLVKKIAETNDIVKRLEYQAEKEKMKQRIEKLTEEKDKIEQEILCLNDSMEKEWLIKKIDNLALCYKCFIRKRSRKERYRNMCF